MPLSRLEKYKYLHGTNNRAKRRCKVCQKKASYFCACCSNLDDEYLVTLCSLTKRTRDPAVQSCHTRFHLDMGHRTENREAAVLYDDGLLHATEGAYHSQRLHDDAHDEEGDQSADDHAVAMLHPTDGIEMMEITERHILVRRLLLFGFTCSERFLCRNTDCFLSAHWINTDICMGHRTVPNDIARCAIRRLPIIVPRVRDQIKISLRPYAIS
jgi:hypothetical protein